MTREEALKVLKELHDTALFSVRTALETLIPELVESEDERIRKALIEFLREAYSKGIAPEECAKWLVWLDKPKEQKPLNETSEYLKGVARVQDDETLTKFEKGFDRIAETYARRKNKEGYNKPWHTKERAAEMLYWAKEELGLLGEQKPAEKQDYYRLTNLERVIHRGFLVAGVENVPVAIIKETAKECLAEMKPVEWSEDDEEMLEECCSYLDERQCNWLKSFRPHWKPSKEQMVEATVMVGHETYAPSLLKIMKFPDKEYIDFLYWLGCYTVDWWLGQRCIENKQLRYE